MKTRAGNTQVVAVLTMVALVALALAVGSWDRGWMGAVEAGPSSAYLSEIEAGLDHITVEELASRVLGRDPGLALVDLRPAEEYQAYHLPGARNLDVPALVGAEGRALCREHELVVLYSNGPAHPGQAWVELRRAGHDNVRVLDGGLDHLFAELLTPPSLRGPTSEAESKAEAASFALRRIAFGLDRLPVHASWASDPTELTTPTVVSPAWLVERSERVALLDVRPSDEDYARLHLPGARHLVEKSLRVREGDRELFLRSPDELAGVFGALGIDAETPVVLYAEDRLQDATLVALALVSLGHQRLAILEGGISAWTQAGGALTASVSEVRAKRYVARPAEAFAIGVDELAQAVAAGQTRVLDVRPPEFFRGEKSTEARPGHIPGAVNRLYTQDIADKSYWREREVLAADYSALGLDPAEPVVVSCRTGHTASESFFVLRYLLGYRFARWYNGSWTEWAARSDLPAALGS